MAIPATPDQQRQLLELQRVDTELEQLRRRALEPPEQHEVEASAAELRLAARAVVAAADELTAVRAARKGAPAEGDAEAKARAKLADARQRGEGLAASHRERLAAVPAAAAATQETRAVLAERRAELTRHLDRSLLSAYEAARKRRTDPVVVPVLPNGTCAGCRLRIPSLELDLARRTAASAISRCPECDRLLFIGH